MRRSQQHFGTTMVLVRPQGSAGRCRVLLLLLGAVLLSCSSARPVKPRSAFLADVVPLTVVLTTPVQLTRFDDPITPVTLVDSQAITVVFSRPVIALGSDFDQGFKPSTLPFTLSCNMPGRFRWVTTTIARFDPSEPWPTDLSCTFRWNARLTAYDGAVLQLGDLPATRPLASNPLTMSYDTVTSETAARLTDGTWSGVTGDQTDILPEIPPDGKLQLSFNYPVNLAALKAAMVVVRKDGGVPPVGVEVTPCQTPAPGVTLSLDVNSTCATVWPVTPLEANTEYAFRLPAGTRYNALAGPLGQMLRVNAGGLRRFRLPYNPWYPDTNSFTAYTYRRLDVWLVHGLSNDTSLDALATATRLCEVQDRTAPASSPCTTVPFSLSLVNRGRARLTVPSLNEGALYRIQTIGSAAVKDGYGQPLQASSTVFETSSVAYTLQPPDVELTIVLEAGVDTLAAWPHVAHPPPPLPPGGKDWNTYMTSLGSWELDLDEPKQLDQLLRIQAAGYSGDAINVRQMLGEPPVEVAVPKPLNTPGSAAGWTELLLPLRAEGGPDSRVRVVDVCCTPASDGNVASSQVRVLLNTSLSLSVMQTPSGQLLGWVTSTAPGSGPVAGATVSFYALLGGTGTQLLGSCVTGTDGTCALPDGAMPLGVFQPLVALARSNGEAALSAPAYFGASSSADAYRATLVADRRAVTPGDVLKVTGLVQAVQGFELVLPPAGTWAVLQAAGMDPSGKDPQYPVQINAAAGTVHAEIAVPADAKRQAYNLVMYLPAPGSSISSEEPPTIAPGDEGVTWLQYGSFNFVVSEPRPPTVELKLEAPFWARPTDAVSIQLTAVSYIGTAVDGSPITVTWSTARSSGIINVTTALDGTATAVVDLGTLTVDQRPEMYDTLTVSAQWVGPTRELITKDATITIADGPSRLTVERSYDTNLPGINFAVRATLAPFSGGAAIPGVAVSVTLAPAEPEGATCTTTDSCTTTTGAGFDPNCQLALPCVGHFVLTGCVTVPAGSGSVTVCDKQTLGLNATEWDDMPLSRHSSPSLALDKESYGVGASATISLQVPFHTARLMLWWGNSRTSNLQVLNTLPANTLHTITIGPLPSECTTGCTVAAVLDVPRLAPGALALPDPALLPVSRLFDPLAPQTHTTTADLKLEPTNELGVALSMVPGQGSSSSSVEDVDGQVVLAVEPGSTAEVTVQVTASPEGGAAAVAGAEVTLYGVDMSFLSLLPYDLPKPQLEMVVQVAADVTLYGTSAYRLAPGAVRAVFDTLMRRLSQLDPWLPVDTTVQPPTDQSFTPSFGRMPPMWFPRPTKNPVDFTDAAFLARYSSDITPMPPCIDEVFCRGRIDFEDRPASRNPNNDGSIDKGGSGGGAPDDDASIRKAAEFVVTPLFEFATTDANGVATFTFTAPQNLGAFALRAIVADGQSAKYGSSEYRIVVRRQLSLVSSVPRFVRVGDTFEGGVVVTVGSAPATVNVTLSVDDSSIARPTDGTSKLVSFSAEGGLQQEIRFSFAAVGMGTVTATFIASDTAAGGPTDGLEVTIPVEGKQGAVWVATTFALEGSPDSTPWEEGLELPSALPGSGGITLTAGVGYLPAILALYKALPAPDTFLYKEAQPSMLWATQPAVLSYYGKLLAGEELADPRVALSDLVALTHPQYGLLWSTPERWSNWAVSRADVQLNAWALFLAASHEDALSGSGSEFEADWASLGSNQAPVWRAALEAQLVQDAQAARQANRGQPYSDWNTLAWARLALGGEWAPADPQPPAIAGDLSLAALLAAYDNNATRPAFDLQTRLVVSLVLLDLGASNPSPAFVEDTVRDVTSSFRVQGRTAYVSASLGSASAAGLEDQALALLLLVRSGATHQLVPKLAAYVASPGVTAGGSGRVPLFVSGVSYRGQGLAVLALSEYDRSHGSAQPDLDVSAEANGLQILEASFTADSNATTVTQTTAWEDLPRPTRGQLGELNFEATGSGEATVSASLLFVPSVLPAFPAYRGLYVEAALQLVDPRSGGPTGRRVAAVPLASLVALTVQLTSPDDLGAVTLEVMMPGGLEPIDPNLSNGEGFVTCSNALVPADPTVEFGRMDPGFGFRRLLQRPIKGGDAGFGRPGRPAGPIWPVCPAQETRPSLVTFSYLRLSAGTSSVTVYAVAASVGRFVLPPVRAFANDQPELMGMTAAGTFTVCADCTAPTYGNVPQPPKACPNDCSGNGMCNLRTGACVCVASFSGNDCSVAPPAA